MFGLFMSIALEVSPMRVMVAIAIAGLAVNSVRASQEVSAHEAAAMQAEALADMEPTEIHGRFDFMLEDPDSVVDQTTGRGSGNPYDDCANTPIRAKRSDGSTIVKRVDVCD
jgi:hypothetical protein